MIEWTADPTPGNQGDEETIVDGVSVSISRWQHLEDGRQRCTIVLAFDAGEAFPEGVPEDTMLREWRLDAERIAKRLAEWRGEA